MIVQDVGNGPTSFSSALEKKSQKHQKKEKVHGVTNNIEWMKIEPDVLHGTKWITLHGLSNIVLRPSNKGDSNT